MGKNSRKKSRSRSKERPFQWKKKQDKQKDIGVKEKEYEEDRHYMQEEKLRELEKMRQKRLEREKAKEFSEEEKGKIMREKDVEKFEEWKQKEEKFHIEQAKLRSQLRIEAGRERPIDFLVKIIQIELGALTIPSDFNSEAYREPYKIFELMDHEALKELLTEMHTFLGLEKDDEVYQSYWHAMEQLCRFQITLKSDKNRRGVNEEEIYKVTADEDLEAQIAGILDNKTALELNELEDQINSNITNRNFAMDMQYWDTLLNRLKIIRAKQNIKEIYDNFKTKMSKEFIEAISSTSKSKPVAISEQKISGNDTSLPKKTIFKENKLIDLYDDEGYMSPILYDEYNEKDIAIIDETEDIIDYEESRITLTKMQLKKYTKNIASDTNKNVAVNSATGDNSQPQQKNEAEMFDSESKKPMLSDESEFNEPVSLSKTYAWQDKYKPRKPRFFNRVKTGYEWNKYNQTHYDQDNPPPKTVQGYKFNVFYPDLIEKGVAPQFYLEESETPDTLLIRFNAGPPYEDIAFKIVNKEWELSEKHGFKCVFDRGILHLYFNFKRHRYRR